MKMTTMKILILGDHKVGKSAVTVRFLTKRFIGEYYSSVDHVYRSSVRLEDFHTDIEVLDTCSKGMSGIEEKQIQWADALVIIYSICSRQSFNNARQLLSHHLRQAPTAYLPVLLLGNKRDLEHRREVGREEGDEVALEHGCQYYEVSAADSALSVSLAFQGLLREVRRVQQKRAALLKRRRGSLGSVGKMLGAMFGLASFASSSGGGTGSKNGGERRTSFSGGGAGKESHASERRLSLSLSNGSKDSNLGSERRLSVSGCGGWGKDSPSFRDRKIFSSSNNGSGKESGRERKISPTPSNGKDIVKERKVSSGGKESGRERKTSPIANSAKDNQRGRVSSLSVGRSSKDTQNERSLSPSPTFLTIPEKERKLSSSPSSPAGQENHGHPDWTLAVSLGSTDGHSD